LISIRGTQAARLKQITGEAGTPAIRIGQVVERGNGKPMRMI